MKEIVLTYSLTKSDQGSYKYLPFEIPEGIERVDISYGYEGDNASSQKNGKDKNVIDFGLLNNNGDDVGTRGNEVRSVTFSEAYASPGFKRTKPVAGTWQIIVGAYLIKKKGVTVRYKITLYPKTRRWLKGDTHLHTDNSDGKYTYRELADKAKKIGLDYIFVTDHNNTTEGKSMPEVSNLLCIRGVELTSYKGHINMWGLAKPYSGSFACNDKESMLERNREAHENGALQSVNHPTCTLCPWLLGLDDFWLDAIEVWNGPMRKDNLSAIELWNGLLKEGKRIPMVGGSDYHRDYVVPLLLAQPTTRVYADALEPEAILDAIKCGRSVVTHNPRSTMPELTTSDGGVIGDVVKYKDGDKVKVSVTKMKRGHELVVIDNDGVSFSYKAARGGDYTFEVPLRCKGFVRAEIRYKKGFFASILHRIVLHFMIPAEAKQPIPKFVYALTNPIYLD